MTTSLPPLWREWLATHAPSVTRTPTALHVGEAVLDFHALTDPARGWVVFALAAGEAPPPLAGQMCPEAEAWAKVVAHLLDLAREDTP